MVPRSIYEAFLAHEGIALLQFRGDGLLKPLATLPAWCDSLWRARGTKPVRLAQKSPFLENFLAEAEEFWNSQTSGTANSGNWIEQDSSGKQIPLEASAFWLDRKRVLLIRNLSGSFAEQQQLYQTARDSLLTHERLMREIQKKEILLHCIIHDLSQPLTSMRGCFDLLLGKKLVPDIAKLIHTGRRESQRQERMIRGILEAFSGELTEEPSSSQATGSADLISCARRSVEQFAPPFAERGVRLVLAPYFDSERDWRVVGDSARIDPILGNLLENALRYSPTGSTVRVGVEDSGLVLTAFVEDEGPGLAEGTSQKDLFALLRKGKDRPGKAGLGLYFCKMTVERWGGTIGAENRAEGGSRFWFRLPRATQASANSPESSTHKNADVAPVSSDAALKPSESTLRIVVADDDTTIRELAMEMLRARGHSVTGVADGRAALAAFDRVKPDVLVLDQEMPEMDGLEVASAIRQKEKQAGASRAKLVGLSGNTTAEDARRSIDAGMDALLGKPFERDTLFQVIERPASTYRPAEANAVAASTPQERSLWAQLKRVTRGNHKLARKLVAGFLADFPPKLSAIQSALSRNDAEDLASAAHALRGAFAIFNAQKSVAAARNLEAMGRDGRLQGASKEFRTLSDDLRRLARDLRALFPDASPHAKLAGMARRGARAGDKR